MDNYYQILGLSTSAKQDEIKAAFKRLAKEFHPDKHNGSDKYYEEQFKKINSAYQTLSNPARKAQYDLKLKYRATGATTYSYKQRGSYYSAQKANKQRRARNEREARIKKEEEKRQQRNMFFWISGGFLIFIISCLIFYKYMNHYTAKLSLKEGIEAEKEKRYLTAIDLYTQALEYDDEYADAYKRRADIKLNIYSNYKSALPDYTGAIKYSKNEHWSSLFSRAKCSAKLGMYEEAIQDLNYAIRLNPQNDSIYFYRAEINAFILKLYAEAIADYDLIISRDSSFRDARFGRSLANFASADYKKAIRDLTYLVNVDSVNRGKYFLWRGFSKISIGDTTGACTDWNESQNMGVPGSSEQLEKYCTRK